MPILWGLVQSNSASLLSQIETDTGKRPTIVTMGTSWHGGGAYPAGAYNTAGVGSTIRNFLNTVQGNGQIPWIDWYTDLSGDTSFALKKIYVDGTHDAFLAQFAQDMAAWGNPCFFRMDGEMNGSWHPAYYDLSGFGPVGRTNAAGDFVLMWQHVLNIFRSNGATNISWVWAPNVESPTPSLTYASIFPGASYVDWLGLDGYNWGGSAPGGGKTSPWMTFSQVLTGFPGWLGNSWADLTALDANLPVVIAETGCDPREGTDTNANANTTAIWNGQKKGDWLTDVLNVQVPGNGATDFSRIKALMYFNDTDSGETPPLAAGFSTGNGDWPIEDPTVASGKTGGGIPQSSFQAKTGINSTHYAAGGQIILPAGMNKIYPYHGSHQDAALTRAVLATAPAHLKSFWKLAETSGTSAADSGSGGLAGTYTGGYTLNQPKIVPGSLGPSVLFNGTTGYVTVPNNAALSPSTTGKQTIMVVFQMASLPASGFATLCGKSGGTGFETAIRVLPSGAMDGHWWNLGGGDYANASFSGTVAVGTVYIAFWTLDNTRSPVGRAGLASLGGALAFLNSADTLMNTPAAGTGTFDIGRRADNSQYANAYISHVATWDIALSDVSMTELTQAMTIRRDKPRMSAVA